MANYLNKEGILYTQEEIESAAQENGVDIDTIIADNELTLGGDENNTELPGKKKRVTAKKPTVTQSKLKTKSASPTKATSSDSSGKIYPWQSKDATINPSSTDKFKKQAVKEKGQGVPTTKNINKSNKTTENFIANNPFDLQNGSLMDGDAGVRDFLNLLPEEEEKKFKEAQAVANKNALNRSEREAISFIDSKVNRKEAEDQLASEINDSEFSDYLREGAKSWYNEAIGGPISMVGQSLGANIDLTISPKKPLAEEKKQAAYELAKNPPSNKKITISDIDARAKEIFIENKIVDQKGKAAEEYFDNLDNPQLQEKLKIKAIGDKLNSSSIAKQRTYLSKLLNTQLADFATYATKFKSKYDLGEINDEEIAEYKVKLAEATAADKQLKYLYSDFPSVNSKLDSDTAKLDYFKYNYDDVEGNLMRMYGAAEKIVGGTAKLTGELVSYFEEGATDTKVGELISATGGDILSDSEKRAKGYKNISFDSVNSFSDFGKYAGILFAEQVPIYASMFFGGEAGAYSVAASSGGQKIQEMEDEIGVNYDRGTKLLTAFAFAAAEFIPEKIGTLRMFENMKSTMNAVNQESRQLFKQNFIDASLKYVGKTGVESFIEGSTESFTEFLDFTIDEQFLGKKISSEEKVKRTKNAFVGGAIMAGGMQGLGGASTLVSKELKNYATNNELAASKKIMDRIDFLQNEIQSNMGLTSKETLQIKSEIDKLTDDSMSIIENSKDRVYDMTSKDMVAVLDINRKQQDIKQSYAELVESNFSDTIKQEKASELKDEFNKLEHDRNFLLTGKYAAANRIIGNGIAIDSSIENIRKLANSLGEQEVANKIGGQSGVAVFEDQSDLKQAYKQWLVTENKSIADESNKLTPEQIDNKVEEAGNSDGFILPNGQIVINKTIAAQTGAVNVANHEFLHKVLRSAFSNPTELKKTVDSFISTLSEKERAIVQKRIDDNYRYTIDENGNKSENNFNEYAEEYFTAFIDAIAKGDIKWDSNLKESLIRVANPIVKLLQKLGFTNIKFNEGRDFYNFLKDYQTNISKGRITSRANSLLKGEAVDKITSFSKSIEERMDILDEQLSSGEIDIDQYETKMTALEKEESQLKRAEYEQKKEEAKVEVKTETPRPKKEKTELSDIAAKAKAKLDAIGNDSKGFNANDPAIYTELDKMVKAKSRNWRTSGGTIIDFTNKDKGGLDGFDLDEMASYVRTSMIPYIAKFDPAKNNSLYGYINAQYANRMRAALKSGEVANVVFTEDVSEMKGLSNEEVEITKPSLPERKRFQNILESGVFSPDVIENISAKVIPIVRTLRSKINEKISINKTTAPIIAEIKDEMGKQADIDIKKAMGGKENQELQNWLITNKKTILENMTTTWLMGKDGKGGMPFAIQKRIGGRWVNFPEWVGKKIDRESVSTDLAGRTAGHEMVRRLPDVDKNVSTMEFLSSIIDLKDGSPIRGRKEALAKALAEEISFDLISDDISNDGPIASALQKNQELLGAVTERILAEEFNRLSERGNIKFSKNILTEALNEIKDNAYKETALYNKQNILLLRIDDLRRAGYDDEANRLSVLLDAYKNIYRNIYYKKVEQYSKSLSNNLNSFDGIKDITLISDYISKNNAKRIDAETSFDILNDTLKDIENYWGILPNEVIASMERTIDYAFDVIEDRENDGGPLMAAVNDALNVETLKNTEKQLNAFIENNKRKDTMLSKSTGNYTTVYAGAPEGKNLKEIGRKGVNFFATDKREADEYARMNDGATQEFVINKNDIVDEDIVFDKIKELGLEPVSNKYTIDEQMLYELIDPRFEGALSNNNITALFNALRKDGIKAISYTDGAQVTGNTTKSIAVIDTSVLGSKTDTKFSKSLSYDFNDMLERNTGVASYEKVSDIVAKRTGVKANKLSFFIPPSAEDFRGLTTYMFSGKGKAGEADQQFFDENLVVPYVKGINTLDSVRQSIKNEYKKLLNDFPTVKSKLEKLTPDKQFTYDQAVRVYLWNKSNIEIPGIDRKTKNKLVYFVKTDSDLLKFAESLSLAARQNGKWMEPSTTWDSETIISDLHNITEGAGRKAWLSEFIENADNIFSPENLNKVQSIYGTNVRIALEDSLYRMKNGKSRPEGTDNLTNKWMNWINGSTAAIMFFNTRSALLQTISAINYLNWTDNNVWTSAKAFANQKQYWSDFAMIINSDKMKERRSGLKADVTQAEIANAANSAKSKALGILSYLQKIGFTPTQAADSFSIAIGGAAFYRNRVKTYQAEYSGLDAGGNLKRKYTDKEAEDKAWVDFSNITDQSMQSADPLYVSKQQTTSLGRLVLAFGNTPMQYNRLIKKAALDIANKRGNFGTNISKIIYYGALQNFIFSALQAALFLPFDDEKDEEELAAMSKEDRKAYEKLIKKQNDKTIGIANGMVDTVLRGSGITGALISTIKNTIIEYNKQEEREMFADHAQTLLSASGISPSISSKARKVYGIIRMNKFEKDVIAERGWEVTRDGRLNLSPNYKIAGNAVVATTNIPLDRLVEKIDNVSEALDSRNNKIQRIALSLGWKPWELNVKNEESEQIKAKAKEVRKKEGVEKSIKTRADKKEAEEANYKAMSPQEKMVYRRQKSKEQAQKRKEKAQRKLQEIRKKRKMGE